MSLKVLFAAIAHIQTRKSICRSPGEDGLVRSSLQMLQEGDVGVSSRDDCPAPFLPHSAWATISVQMGHLILVLPWCLCGHVPTCHPLLQNCTRWSWVGEVDLTCCSHTAGVQRSMLLLVLLFLCLFVFKRGFFPQSSSWAMHNKCLKTWNSEATGSFFIMEHLITVAHSFCVFSFLQDTKLSEACVFDETQHRFFSKAFSSKINYSQSIDWSLAISSPAHIRNVTPTMFSEIRIGSLYDVLLHQGLSAGRESFRINV